MKKLLTAVFALTAILASCNQPKEEKPVPDHIYTTTITANVVEMPKAITRTSLESENYFQIWNNGDEISVIDGNRNEKFSLLTGDGTAYGKFKGQEVDAVKTLYAVYPYGEGNSAEKGFVTVTYPDHITYDPETCCAMGNNVMVGWNVQQTQFEMRNACALIRISLRGSVAIKKIEISGKDGEDIAGIGVVNCGLGDDLAIESVEGSKTVTVDLGEEGVLLQAIPTDFVIGLAPVFQSGVVCKYTTADGDVVENVYNFIPEFNTISLMSIEDFRSPTVYMNGAQMNATIKTLAQGKTCQAQSPDAIVKSIVFVPEADLSTVSGGVDVSDAGDGRIIATYDGGVATVYTDGRRIAADMYQMFRNFNALESIEGSSCLSAARTQSLDYAFAECKALKALDLSAFDFSAVASAAHAFENTASLESFNVSGLSTASGIGNMSYMFSGCGASSIEGIGSLNTGECADMSYMFSGSKVAALDLRNFNTAKVTTMGYMFSETEALATSLDLSSFNTENVEDMAYMFSRSAVTGVVLSSFKTSKVSKMANMFNNASNLVEIDLSTFTLEKEPKFDKMFAMDGTYALTKVTLGPGFTALNGTNQNTLFSTYKASMPSFTVLCTKDMAQDLIAKCTSRTKNSVNLIANQKMVLQNLSGTPYTYTDKDGNAIDVSAVTNTSIVVE